MIHIFSLAVLLSLFSTNCNISKESQENSPGSTHPVLPSKKTRNNPELMPDKVEKSAGVAKDDLRILSMQTSSEKTGDHYSLKLTVDAGEHAKFIEFFACSRETPGVCNPTRENPGVFIGGEHSYPKAPGGLLDVGLRACVRDYQALDGLKTCGEWESGLVKAGHNQEGELSSLLWEKYQQEQIVSDLGSKTRGLLLAYQDQSRSLNLTKEHEDGFDTLVQNQINAGEDASGRAFQEGHVDGLKDSLDQSDTEENEEKSWTRTPSTGGWAILAVGSAAVIGGVASVVSGVKMNRLAKRVPNPKVESGLLKKPNVRKIGGGIAIVAGIAAILYERAMMLANEDASGSEAKINLVNQLDNLFKSQYLPARSKINSLDQQIETYLDSI